MPTPRQEKLADAIIANAALDKPKTMGEILESVGYSQHTATAMPGRTIEQQGVQDALEARGFSVDNAKRVVGEILENSAEKASDRLRAADQIFQVHGAYAPVKSAALTLNADIKDFAEYDAISERFDEEMKNKLLE